MVFFTPQCNVNESNEVYDQSAMPLCLMYMPTKLIFK